MTVEYKDHFEMLSSEAQALISQIQLSGGFDIYVVNETHRSTTFLYGTTFFLAPYDHAIEYSSWNAQASITVYQIVDYADIYQKIPIYGGREETYTISNVDLNVALTRLFHIIRMRKELSDQMYREHGPEMYIRRMEAKLNANTEHTTGSESCYPD